MRDQEIGIDMKEVTGLEIFIKMNTEIDLVKCIEKMIERIVENKLMKETEDINLRIDISQVMIDGAMLTVAVVDLLQVQNLVLDMSKIRDSARCSECGKTNHLVENCPTLSEQEREMYRLHYLQYVEYLRTASDISDDIQRKLLSRYSTEYTTESVVDREVQYVKEKVESETNTYVQEEVISHIALLKIYMIEAKVQENVQLEQQVVMPTAIYFIAEKYVTQGEMEVVQKIPKISKFQAQVDVVSKIPLLDVPCVFLLPDLFTKRLKKVLGVSVLKKTIHDRMCYLGQEIFREVVKFKTLCGLGIRKNVNENEKEILTDIIPIYRPPPRYSENSTDGKH